MAVLTRNPNLSPSPTTTKNSHQLSVLFQDTWWTGLAPHLCPGFDSQKNELHALPLVKTTTSTRLEVLNYFDNTWTLTELLFQSLKTESAFMSPPYHGLRHPLIFYYGHPAVLFVNKLRLAGLLNSPVDLYLEKVLETGVDEMSWDDMSKNEMSWPSVQAVHGYRKKIYHLIRNLILTHPDLENPSQEKRGIQSPIWALFMGFEHEKIHFETTSVLIRELPVDWVENPKYWPAVNPTKKDFQKTTQLVQSQPWQKFSAQVIQWGKKSDTPTYGWDNEYGSRQVQLKDFEVTPFLITNAEYYEFVKSGSYIQDQYWSEEGLRWRKFRNTKRPCFWLARGPEGLHDYQLRTLFEIIEMPWDWPAEVNFHEAQAYCKWKQNQDQSSLVYRLITEPEHVALRDHSSDPVTSYEYTEKYNFNFQSSSASPVDFRPANSKKIYDLFGNVWQWAEDQFNPLEGFEVHPLYDDFSTPCFDGKHQMILGGSFISCGHEASQYARFHFRPHFYQHSGFRMARSLDGSSDNGSKKLIQQQAYVHPVRKSALHQIQNDTQDWWKNIQQPLELSPQELETYWSQSVEIVKDLELQIAKRAPMGSALDGETHHLKPEFQIPYQTTKQFPNRSSEFDKNLKLITEELAPQGQQPGHPGYMAYVAGAGNPISVMAQAISMTLNPYSSHFNMAPGLVALEAETLKWFINLMGLPENTAGGLFTTGGSLANLQALAAARTQKLKTTHLENARIYASTQVHHCIGKALSFLGFPQECLALIDVDHQFRMQPKLLKKQIQKDISLGLIPLVVVATAGSTNTGAVDPLDEIIQIAQEFEVWCHIDGAYGAPFMLTTQGQEKLKAIGMADSIALDPHKAMSLPYGTGLLMVKNRNHLCTDYPGASTYMPPSSGLSDPELRLDFADIGPELSRDFRGLRVWLPIKTLGIEPFQLNLEEKLKLSEYLHSKLLNIPELVIEAAPQLSIQAFRHQSPQLTRKLMGLINSKNHVFLSGCTLSNGQFVIRVCLLGHHLHFEQIQIFLKDLKESLNELRP